MKDFYKKHCYAIYTVLSAFVFTYAITFTTGFNINNWQWWCITISAILYSLTEYYKGRRDGYKENMNVIIKLTKERLGDDIDISVKDIR